LSQGRKLILDGRTSGLHMEEVRRLSKVLETDAGSIAIVECGDHVFLTARPRSSQSENATRRLFDWVANAARERSAVPVHERVFGSESFLPFVEEARRSAFSGAGFDGPATSVDGEPPVEAGFSGVFVHCIKQRDGLPAPEIVQHDGAAVGRKWQTPQADFLVLQDIGADFNSGDAPPEQARRVFERMDRLVSGFGFSFRDVVRTWFYLTNILSWYGDFNKVRSAAYRGFGVMPKSEPCLALPSSTGIGCRNSKGRAVAADVLLVRPRDGARPNRILNPSQKEAYEYGSAFSRAVEIKDDNASLIEISGTAAVDEQGSSVFPNDAAAQVGCTLDKIEVLLGQVGGTIRDIASATVFVKRPAVARAFAEVCAARGIEHFPALVVCADVCRDELLFEIDAEVVLETAAD
jgi:enamine deaminase RidA (YjgF/YER057c/UK114 family)